MSRKGEVKKIIEDWMDKEILIPDDVMFQFFGRDTVCSYLWNKSHKVFTYIDSIGCSSCQLDLFVWK